MAVRSDYERAFFIYKKIYKELYTMKISNDKLYYLCNKYLWLQFSDFVQNVHTNIILRICIVY